MALTGGEPYAWTSGEMEVCPNCIYMSEFHINFWLYRNERPQSFYIAIARSPGPSLIRPVILMRAHMDIISEYYYTVRGKLNFCGRRCFWKCVYSVQSVHPLTLPPIPRCRTSVPRTAGSIHRLSVWCLLPFPPSIKNRRVTKNRLAGPHVTDRAFSYSTVPRCFLFHN